MSIKREKLFVLKLDLQQLTHLRDLLSITLPPRYVRRISTDLALTEKREEAEDALWKEVYSLCEDAGLALNDAAPDFSLEIAHTPRLEIARLESED